jgi:hypothetical protein
MAMKIIPLLFGLFALCSAVPPILTDTGRDTTAADSIKKPAPDYKDVNVIVETDWGTTDKTEHVDVILRTGKNNHKEIVMQKSTFQECVVELVSGMVVKIVDSKTGKVLKTVKP